MALSVLVVCVPLVLQPGCGGSGTREHLEAPPPAEGEEPDPTDILNLTDPKATPDSATTPDKGKDSSSDAP